MLIAFKSLLKAQKYPMFSYQDDLIGKQVQDTLIEALMKKDMLQISYIHNKLSKLMIFLSVTVKSEGAFQYSFNKKDCAHWLSLHEDFN